MAIQRMIQNIVRPDVWNVASISRLVIWILLLITSGFFIFNLVKYFYEYRIFASLIAKISGNLHEYDRIKRQQLKKDLEKEKNTFTREKQHIKPMQKIYELITATGITEKIPGFSESFFLVGIILITCSIFGIISYFRSINIGILFAGAFLLIVWYILDLIAYNRRMALEKQLLQFTNACATASIEYSNIIDIFGAIYDQFSAPLREGLESCYVEAKTINDRECAISHLQKRYNSPQFNFILDNLQLCSAVTGDYHAVARDIAETISIYSQSHEKKRILLRNAKINILMMFVASIGIFYSLSLFLDGLWDVLLKTTFGNVIGLALILILFYGMNLKTEK